MPTYEHRCAVHGAFEERRDHRLAGDPAGCPVCGEPSPRVFGLSIGGGGPAAPAGAGGEAPRVQRRDELGKGHKPHEPHVHRPWMIGH